MAKQKTARKPTGLARSYPYYLANAAVAANTDLEVRDKYSGKIATRVAMGDAAAIRKAIVAAHKARGATYSNTACAASRSASTNSRSRCASRPANRSGMRAVKSRA